MTDLDRLHDHLEQRAQIATIEATPIARVVDRARQRDRRKRAATGASGAAVVGGFALAAVWIGGWRDGEVRSVASLPDTIEATTPTPTVSTEEMSTAEISRADIAAFTVAIEASGVLTAPSADEIGRATDGDLYREEGITQISAAGHSVSLRRCRTVAAATCGSSWAYVTGFADEGPISGGLLGSAGDLDLHLLDHRYFVASESSPGERAPSVAWLIDAVSGKAGILSWRDEPTTLTAPEQALLLCADSYITRCATTYIQTADGVEPTATDGGLPSVIDSRDGTIRPLVMPDDVVSGLSVVQRGIGRIWVGTDPDGDGLGLAYSDDGGATWIDVTLPVIEDIGYRETLASGELYEIAADGDRVAVALAWGGDTIHVSEDAGRSWTTAHSSKPLGNGAHLYVLADGRLALMWSMDAHPKQVLASTGSWTELENVDIQFPSTMSSEDERFSVNRAGIAIVPSFFSPCEDATPCSEDYDTQLLDTIDFSADLRSWSTIEFIRR